MFELAMLPPDIEQIREERPLEALNLYQQETDFWSVFWSAMLTKWNVSNTESLAEFEAAIALYPDSELLKQEYARNLAELLRYAEATAILDGLLGGEYDSQARSILPVSGAISVTGQAFRPDDKNRIRVSASASGPSLAVDGDIAAIASYLHIENPDTDIFTAAATITPDRQNSYRVGASVLPGETIPSAGYTRTQDDWRLSYDYRANLDDPVAIQSGIAQHVFEVNYQSLGGKLSANDDGVQVYEAWATLPVADWASIEAYGRAASGDSPNYWTPSSFGSVGLGTGVNVSGGCLLGIQLGMVIDEGEVKPALPVGAQCSFPGGSVRASYGYGLSIEGRIEF